MKVIKVIQRGKKKAIVSWFWVVLLKIYRLLKGFFVVVVVVFSFFLFFSKTAGLILKSGAVAGAFLFPLCYFIQLNLEYMTQNTKTHTILPQALPNKNFLLNFTFT